MSCREVNSGNEMAGLPLPDHEGRGPRQDEQATVMPDKTLKGERAIKKKLNSQSVFDCLLLYFY